MGVQRAREHHAGTGVGGHVALHAGVGEGLDRVVLEGRGVVDDRVDAAEVRRHLRQQRAGRGFVAQVGGEGSGAGAERARVHHRGFSLGSRAAVVHGHIPAVGSQVERDGPAQAAGGAGDERDGAGVHAFYNASMNALRSRAAGTVACTAVVRRMPSDTRVCGSAAAALAGIATSCTTPSTPARPRSGAPA